MFPLKGIKVLDLTVNSGYCGMELADYGAEVIKIESPKEGDSIRNLMPLKDGTSVHHIFRDRGKKSITLDINVPEGQEIFKKLVREADVVLENFQESEMENLGLGYQSLREINPRLVYGKISAYGSKGAGSNVPQCDLIAQAKSGVMHFTGFPENPPTRIGFSISERYAASFLSSAVCVALYHAGNTGEGQYVETTLCGSAIAISEDKVITYGSTGEDPMRTGNAHPLINPYDILKCKDGYVAMGISSDAQWAKFCDAFKCPQWKVDEFYCSNLVRGYHYFGDLRVKLEELFSKYTMQEIADICDNALIPGTMCSTTKEALEQPQLKVRNMIVSVDCGEGASLEMPGKPVKFAGFDEEAICSAPSVGESNADVYQDLGIDDVEQQELKEKGII